MQVVWAEIGLERVKDGLKKFGKGARVKKRGWDLIILHYVIPYSGKFSNGANFRIFRMLAPYSKIKTAKI